MLEDDFDCAEWGMGDWGEAESTILSEERLGSYKVLRMFDFP